MRCPTCERTCGDEEEVCLRCRTVLREPVAMMDAPAAEAPSGKSYGWIWGVLAVLLAGSVFRTCAKVGREQAQARAAPAPSPEDYRQAFLTSFTTACLKKGNPASFCSCAGPKVLDNFREDEIEDVIESTRNGKPDLRMSTIIVQCSR